MSAHTPGPWEVRTTHSDDVTRYVRMPDGTKVVVSCLPLPVSAEADANARANARLIAAAPELLAACQEILAHPAFSACDCGEEDCATSRLRAAVAKATGGAP